MPGSYVTLVMMLAAFGLVTAGIGVALSTIALLRPPRMSDGKAAWVLKRLSPGDLELKYQDMNFTVRDERTGRPLQMRGWWIPHPAAEGRCVILIHGFADAKVGAISVAPLWHALSFNILAIDLRAHGQSDGAVSTGGYWERHDLDQIINQLRAQHPRETQRLVLHGIGLGAGVAAATAALRNDLNGLILESPYADFKAAAAWHMIQAGLPTRLLPWLSIRLAEFLTYSKFDEIRPVGLISSVHCPIMLIFPEDDAVVSPESQRQLKKALTSRQRAAEDCSCVVKAHGEAMASTADLRDYEAAIGKFLGPCCKPS